MNDVPAEIKDRLLIECTRFAVKTGVDTHLLAEFMANISLILGDYYYGLHNPDYKEKSTDEVVREIIDGD